MNKTLKIIRIKRGITQWDLSHKTGIRNYKISLFENGHIEPNKEEKKKLAKALKVKIADIFPDTIAKGNGY